MKKKIKDLTLEEAIKICCSYFWNICHNCPLKYKNNRLCHKIKLVIMEEEKDFDSEREVEVDD